MEKIVHIIPLGYEIDRAVKPFLSEDGFRPNKVYLLTCLEPNGTPSEILRKHRKYHVKVRDILESLNIEVLSIHTILIDLFDTIMKVSRVIVEEKKQGNIVYINMSAAGRLTSVGATIAGMVHDVKLYYVKSDGYSDTPEKWEAHGQSIVDIPQIDFLEHFRVEIPDENKRKVLVEIYNHKQMKTSEIIDLLVSMNAYGFDTKFSNLDRSQRAAAIMKISRRVLSDLDHSGYIRKIRNGRDNIYEITQSGKYIAGISGLLG